MSPENDNASEAWKRFLNPETLRGNIICAAVYIVAYEILKESIIDKIKTFFATEYENLRPVESARYRANVLSLNRSPLYASLIWLKENGAVDDADLKKFEAIKNLRNRFAHDMMPFLAGDGSGYPAEPFGDMVELLRKIEIWWFENLEMAIAPEDFPDDLDLDEVTPGRVFSLQLLIRTALGSEEEARTLYQEYLEQTRK